MKTLIYAIRFLSRSKAYTIINLLGLAYVNVFMFLFFNGYSFLIISAGLIFVIR